LPARRPAARTDRLYRAAFEIARDLVRGLARQFVRIRVRRRVDMGDGPGQPCHDQQRLGVWIAAYALVDIVGDPPALDDGKPVAARDPPSIAGKAELIGPKKVCTAGSFAALAIAAYRDGFAQIALADEDHQRRLAATDPGGAVLDPAGTRDPAIRGRRRAIGTDDDRLSGGLRAKRRDNERGQRQGNLRRRCVKGFSHPGFFVWNFEIFFDVCNLGKVRAKCRKDLTLPRNCLRRATSRPLSH
jgi:hypothetical protein